MSLLHSSPELNFSPTASDISPSLPPNPATIARPAVVDSASAWSCVTCRRRKVRCNKQSPCSNCIKSGIECVFPLSRQASRKSRRPADQEVLSRLRRLEDVIEHLRGKNAEAGSATSLSSVQAAPLSTTSSAAATETSAATTCIPAEPQKAVDGVCAFADSDPKKASSQKFENEFGRLVIDESRSRYVSNLLWASLGNEIEELKDILHDFVSEDDGTASPECSNSSNHDGFLFGFYSISHSLREYYPPSPKALILWKAYKENVAPLITIIHRPTARKLFIAAAQHPETLDKNSEALVFSMCLSAVVSMSPAQCLSLLGADRETAVKRYRFAVEQALARANFLNTQSLILLQAAVLFLICVRREDDSNFVWSLNAIVLRLAQGLGLHRDGTNFGLKPFETEMRRRLWWHICLIDTRSSEDHGTDPLIHQSMYDTRLPLNINDDDIYPEMDETPQEREGFTDVTFCLIRCEITVTLRHVNYACASGQFRFGGSVPCKEGCGGVLQIINKWVEERYIKHCDLSIPIHWASALAARLILSKLWLIMHHPMTRNDRVTSVPQATRESLFLTAIEVLEFGRLLETNDKTSQWAWLFRTNMQWHEFAFVLSEICVRPSSPVTDRAWLITNSLYSDWEWQTKHKKGMLWRPLAALMSRAALTRAKQQELRAQFGPTITAPSEPTEHFMPGSTGGGDRPLPRIHLSMELLPPSSATQTSQTVPTVLHTPLNVDLSKGPWDDSQDIFPDASTLPMQNVFGPSLQQNLVSVANLPTGPPYNNSMDPVTDEDALPSGQLSWDEWDQVMREFQIDVENSGAGSSMPSNITEWFA